MYLFAVLWFILQFLRGMDGTLSSFSPPHRSHICKPNIIVNIHCFVTLPTHDPISLPPRGILCLFLAFPFYLLPEIEICLMDACSGSKTWGLQFCVYANKMRMTDSSSSSRLVRKLLCFLGSQASHHTCDDAETKGRGRRNWHRPSSKQMPSRLNKSSKNSSQILRRPGPISLVQG